MDEQTNDAVQCKDVLTYICSHFGEDDNSERCRQVKEHLAHCPDCAKYCNSLETMIGLYRASAPEFPSHAREHLLKVLGVDKA